MPAAGRRRDPRPWRSPSSPRSRSVVGPARPDPARRLEAVELGHLDVHEDQVVVAGAPGPRWPRARRRDVGRVAHPFEEAEGELPVHRVVLGDEDPKPRVERDLRLAPAPGRRPLARRASSPARSRGDRVVEGGGLDRLGQERRRRRRPGRPAGRPTTGRSRAGGRRPNARGSPRPGRARRARA